MPRIKNNKIVKLSSRHGPATQILISPGLIESLTKMPKNREITETSPASKIRRNFYPDFNIKNITLNMDVEAENQQTNISQPSIPTHNRFSILSNLVEKTRPQTEQQSPAHFNTKPKTTQTSRNIKPPPVIIKSIITKPKEFHQEIKRILSNQEFKVQYHKDETKIFTTTMEARKTIMDQLITDGIYFYTHTPKNEKFYKTVMKAAHFTTEEEIVETLSESLSNPFTCIKLKARNSRSHSFLISTQSHEDYEKLNKIKTLDHINIKWEIYNKKNLVSQCHRCQAFGHGSGQCHMPPKCVKCAEPHLTENHQGPETNPKCANCQGEHTANHRECPTYLDYIEKINTVSSKKPTVNSQNSFKSNYVKPNISYATNLKSNSTPNQNQTTQNQTQNQITITPTQNQTNQQNNNIQDFKTLINEINELNNICNIKNMINLIRELKTKLVQASTPLEKIYILQEISEKYSI